MLSEVTMLKTTRIGIAQHACSNNQDENIERATAGVLECVQQGANIVCLQELVNTIYFCQTEEYEHFDLAQPLDGPLVQHFQSIAKDNDVVIVVPFFERRASGVYHNTAVVLDADGSTAGVYRKMHIPDDPGFMEKFYFTPGDLGFKAIPTKFGKVGVMICWDQWFPEGGSPNIDGWCRLPILPNCNRLVPKRTRASRTLSKRVADVDARPCHRQRYVCCGREPRRRRG